MAMIGNVIVRVGANINPMQQGLQQAQGNLRRFSQTANQSTNAIRNAMQSMAQGSTLNMGLMVSSLSMGRAGLIALGAAAVVSFGMLSANGVRSAMEVEAAVQQLNRIMGASSTAFMEWANTQAIAFNMSRSEALKYGAVYGNLLTTITKDQATVTSYTQDLLKASAVVASATGREMTDVMERIRSGLLGNTESIEDLGINVNVALLESTETFKRFANGKSWDQLDFRTQQQIRLFGILEQATSKYGNEVNKNTSSSIAQLNALLKDSMLNIGQAFLPLVNVVVPILIDFANNLKYVTGVFSQFTQALFGVNSTQSQNATNALKASKAQTALGNATKKAGDNAKKGVAGFDEINQLQESIAANAADATSVTGSSSVTATKQDTSSLMPKGLTEFVDKLKKDFTPALTDLNASFKDLKDASTDLWKTLEPYLKPVAKTVLDTLGNTAEGIAKGAFYKLSGSIEKITGATNIANGLIKGDFPTTLKGLEQVTDGTWKGIKGSVISVLNPIFPDIEDKLNNTEKIWKAGWSKIKDHVKTYGDPTKLEASDFTDFIKDEFSKKFQKVKEDSAAKWVEITSNLSTKWDEIKTNAGTKWEEIRTTLSGKWELIKSITWGDVKDKVLSKWDELKTESGPKWEAFKTTLNDKWTLIKDQIGWSDIKDTVLSKWDDLKKESGPKWDTFKTSIEGKWEAIKLIKWDTVKTAILKVWEGLKTDTATIWDGMGKTIKSSINVAINLINDFINKVNSMKIDIPKVTINGNTIGGGSIGFPQIPLIKPIPLANGGITDVNRPFLAKVGDNKTQREVVAPLGDLTDMITSSVSSAMLNVMQFSQPSQSKNAEANLYVDGVRLARAIIPLIDKELSRIGKPTLLQTV